ncbi:MAG: endolytic transglycosylase MltG, partial [Pseudomonadales bacterium]|nr:endolytic transglycosylase MltG [Pseudomonadales bacterium]
IQAALNPTVNDNIYFVAKGDGSGTHIFSANLSQHNQAVADYLQARKGK